MLFEDAYSGSETILKIKEMNIVKVIAVGKEGVVMREEHRSGFLGVTLCISGPGVLSLTTELNPSFRLFFSECTLYFNFF